MKGALPYPSYALIELLLPGIEQFQSREEYKARTGNDAPVWNPIMGPKYWRDARPALPALVNYAIPVIQDAGSGHVAVQAITLSRTWAQSVNIAPSSVDPADAPREPLMPYPIRALFEDEELVVGLGGIIQVHNRELWAQVTSTSGDLTPIIRLLEWIKAALTKAGVTP